MLTLKYCITFTTTIERVQTGDIRLTEDSTVENSAVISPPII